MPITAHIQQLHHIDSLCSGLEWVTDCPDQGARNVLLRLIGEEMGATVRGVIHTAEALSVGKCGLREEAD
ncbi:hypothetical protein [uncultured Microbulbifer sp.]|uniref:hypothetical protein n=1 Tax=uncultured Microbulbifer sp. TaxID=348147 RepID=UPI0026180FB6|nr:hypothetical protein [uncultured Microbulbifer sp.]